MGNILAFLWINYIILFLFCLSGSYLNQKIHQEKVLVIEGLQKEQESEILSYNLYFKNLLIPIHFFLFISLILLLRQACLAWKTDIFYPAITSLWDWTIYAFDMTLKAILFDIPEIYHLDLIKVEHQGFFGSSLVFFSRVVIWGTVLTALFRFQKVYQLLSNSVAMLEYYPQLAQNKILIIVKMYPKQLRRLCRWCYRNTNTKVYLLEAIGKTKKARVLPTLEKIYRQSENIEIQIACLRGLEFLGYGKISLLQDVFQKTKNFDLKDQACKTLSAWCTKESVHFLGNIAYTSDDLRTSLSAIRALGNCKNKESIVYLGKIVRSSKFSKERRFAAKEAIVAGKFLGQTLKQKLIEDINSDSVENRRFSAMILGELGNIDELFLLSTHLGREEDSDTLLCIIRGISSIMYSLEQEKEKLSQDQLSCIVGIFLQIKNMISHQEETIVLAVIQSLIGFGWLIPKGMLRPHEIISFLNLLMNDQNTSIANTATDVLDHLKSYIKNIPFEKKREKLTAAYLEDLKWRPKEMLETGNFEQQGYFLASPWESTFAPRISEKSICQGISLPEFFQQRYRPLARLVTGKISQVYKVYDMQEATEKVLKILISPQEWALKLYKREIEVLESCRLPGVVALLDKYEEDGNYGFAMAWLGEDTLYKVSNQKKAQKVYWSLKQILQIIQNICSIIESIHSKGWSHGDLKPENIVYLSADRLILIDFNSAFPLIRERDFIAVGGTPYYMAPEQVYQLPCDHRVDIYSLGIISYELFTNCLPLGISPQNIQNCRREIPFQVQKVLARATSFYARDRFSSAVQFAEALAQALH